MSLTDREFWTVLHGMLFGAAFLLAFSGGFASLWSFRAGLVTPEGVQERLRRLYAGVWSMAVVAWVTVMTGTYIVYPWYREAPPKGTTDLEQFPRSLLLADPNKDLWHKFGMEWKEHVAFVAPIMATAVAVMVTYYGRRLVKNDRVRLTLLGMFVTAFLAAAIAGIFGAFINKVAPVK